MNLEDVLAWLANHSLLGIPLFDLSQFIGFLLAGWALGRLLRYPLATGIERLTSAEDRLTSVRVAKGFERSTFFLVFALVLNMGAIDVLHLPGWLWEKLRHFPKILLAWAITVLLLQIVDVALIGLRKRWQEAKSGVDETLVKFIRRGIRVFLILIAVLLTAESMEIKVTSIIAGLGIGGAAFALAAQGLLGNILGTFEIVGDRLFRVGDRIHTEQFDGFVQELGLRSTKIRAMTGEVVTIPNKKVAESQIRNYSRNGQVRTAITLGILYSTPHDQVLKAFKIIGDLLKERKDVESPQIFLKNLGANSLELEAVFWGHYANFSEFNVLTGELNLEIKRGLDSAGIAFAAPILSPPPFPQGN